MRLIDADVLKKYIDDCKCCEKCSKRMRNCNEDCELPDFLTRQWERVIDEQPTVEAEPVRHGHWVIYTISPYDGEDVKCSECGEHGCMPGWDYCPNCGAKMDEEVEHEAY